MNYNERLREMAIKQVENIPEITADKITIKESNFISKYWVDLLSSYIRGETVPIALWYTHVSKSPYNPVEVLDDETGEVLFTVPALLDGSKELYSNDVSVKIGDIVNEAISKNGIVPNSGDNLLIKNLIDTMNPSSSRAAMLEKWVPFMNRYKIQLSGEEGVVNTAQSASVAVYNDSDDYDDDF